MHVFLVDNGSLRPESWMNLCRVADLLSRRIGCPVHPASVSHSSRVDQSSIPASWPRPTTWERATKAALANGERSFVVLPLFFGPALAISEYLPERRVALVEQWVDFDLKFAPLLADPVAGETITLAKVLADQVRSAIVARELRCPPVVLVDHGSPERKVTAVRDRLGVALANELGESVASVRVASMERREGAAYDFNEPLLAHVLRDPDLPAGDVVVSLLFLSPGRHAGLGGDIETICFAAERDRPGLRVQMTELVGSHPGLIDLLEARYRVCVAGD